MNGEEGTKEALVGVSLVAVVLLILSISFAYARKRVSSYKKRTQMANFRSVSFTLFILSVFLLLAIVYSRSEELEKEFERSDEGSSIFLQRNTRPRKLKHSRSRKEEKDIIMESVSELPEGTTGMGESSSLDSGLFRKGIATGLYMQELRLQRLEENIPAVVPAGALGADVGTERVATADLFRTTSSSVDLSNVPEYYMEDGRTW